MNYDWNKYVTITVPKGLNGWVYSGNVTINGIKVEFPVGVETSVPEPAAAMLNAMMKAMEDNMKVPAPSGSIVTAHAKITTLTADKIELDGCDMTFAALWDAYSTGKMVQIMCSNETRMLCGRVNVGLNNDGAKALQMDVPRDIALVGHFVVAIADDGTGNAGFDMIGRVL